LEFKQKGGGFMKKIFKYSLGRSINRLHIPKGAVVLTAQVQKEYICIWVLVDTNSQLIEERTFEVYPTGMAINEEKGMERKYINTVQLGGGELIYHVFERVKGEI